MPFETALREGATDVLVLRSRPARALQAAGANVAQVAVPDGTQLIRRFESSGPGVVEALWHGATAFATAVSEPGVAGLAASRVAAA